MKIPLVDLKTQYSSIKEEIDEAVHGVIERGEFILGSELEAFQAELASYLGAGYAVGVASGTDALHLALLACDIKPGDEVITTPFTFIATTEAITYCGATPVFVDINPETYNIDTAQIEPKITARTSAILPVHLYGQPADMDPILELAKKYNLKIIEDCAQALGAEYKGKKVGTLGDTGCFSFFPSKILGAYGDGGMVTANNPEIAAKLEMLRNHGSKDRYHHLITGFNSRLDSLHAAILRVKLRHLDRWNDLRQQKAFLYTRLFSEIDSIYPHAPVSDSHHIFNYYTIRLRTKKISRDRLREYLTAQGIATAVYYPLSLHLQEVYKSLGGKPGDFPESEQAQEEALSLPIYPEISEKQVEEIVSAIKDFCIKQVS